MAFWEKLMDKLPDLRPVDMAFTLSLAGVIFLKAWGADGMVDKVFYVIIAYYAFEKFRKKR